MLLIRVSFHDYDCFHEYDDFIMIMYAVIFVVTEIRHPDRKIIYTE